MKKNAVVIGAGINGLVASNYLQKNNFNVSLIEKNNYVGGACIKDSIEYIGEEIFYPKGATVLGMMQKFIFNETVCPSSDKEALTLFIFTDPTHLET